MLYKKNYIPVDLSAKKVFCDAFRYVEETNFLKSTGVPNEGVVRSHTLL